MVLSPTSEGGQIHLNLVLYPTSGGGQIHLNLVLSPTSEGGQIHLNLVLSPTSGGGQIHLNLVLSPTSEGGQIHLNLVAIKFTPTVHFDRQSASSLLKPTFTLFPSTCFFHVLYGLPFFLWLSPSKSNALLNTWPSSLLNTWPTNEHCLP